MNSVDEAFFDRRLRHNKYCLVHLDVEDEMVAEYIRRLLRHHELNTKAKRMGGVVRALPTGIAVWRIHQEQESRLSWQ